MNWFEIRLKLPEDLLDSVSNRLFELGAQGIDESEYGKNKLIRGFFPSENSKEVTEELALYAQSLKEMHPELDSLQIETHTLEDQNWGESYKQYYFAQPLSKNIFLRPAWVEPTVVPRGMLEIVLEPGQAFGTGLHPTTKLSLQFVEDALRLYSHVDNLRLVDIGTGTGILAIAAYKLGVRDITAIDIDPVAIEAAKENVDKNGCSEIVVGTQSIAELDGTFDIIVSNILLETHKELASHYLKLLKPGGHLILSGLLGNQKRDIMELFMELGCVLECQKSLQEWMAFRFVKVTGA